MSAAAMPFAGVIIGGIMGGVFVGLLALNVFHMFAVIATLAVGLLLTGALHEDGFADFCDGYFGKRDPKKILSIMKDSHVGTFGVLGLLLLLYSRLSALVLMFGWQPAYIILVLVMAAGLSRLVITLALFLPLAHRSGGSVQHIAKPTWLSCIVSLQVFWLLIFFPRDAAAPASHLPLLLAAIILGMLMLFFFLHQKKNLPLTGDALGFLQSITEIILLFFFLSYFGFQQ